MKDYVDILQSLVNPTDDITNNNVKTSNYLTTQTNNHLHGGDEDKV